MTADAFVRTVVDALLPGDAVLPTGSAAGVVLDARVHQSVMDEIARFAGGAERFVAASAAERNATLQSFAAARPEAFRALLLPLLQDYYEADAVLRALGWRTAPPQPQGHALAPMDEATARRLDAVRRRSPIWRRC